MIVDRLVYNGVRGQWRSYQKSRKQPGGPWTFTAVLFCILPMTVIWQFILAFQGSAVFWLLLPANAVMVLLAMAPVFSRAGYRNRIRAQSTKEARLQDKQDALFSPQSLRERAAELRELEELRVKAGRGGLHLAPEPGVTATWQSAPEPEPDPEETERERRVADLFAVPCPDPPAAAQLR